jgi:hypothetical protein
MDLIELVNENWPNRVAKPELSVFNSAAYERGHAYGQEEVDRYFIDYVNMYLEAFNMVGRFSYEGEFLPYGFN